MCSARAGEQESRPAGERAPLLPQSRPHSSCSWGWGEPPPGHRSLLEGLRNQPPGLWPHQSWAVTAWERGSSVSFPRPAPARRRLTPVSGRSPHPATSCGSGRAGLAREGPPQGARGRARAGRSYRAASCCSPGLGAMSPFLRRASRSQSTRPSPAPLPGESIPPRVRALRKGREGPGSAQGEVPEPAAQRANPRVAGAGDCRWDLKGSLRSRPLTRSPPPTPAPAEAAP